TNPLIFSVPDVPSVQRDVKNVRNLVLTLRQQAGVGQPASVLKHTLNGMIGDYGDAFNRWNQIVATYRLVNPARLSPVGETLNQIEQIINQGLATGDLTPVGPSRAGQDLNLLSNEVTGARQALTAFAGYREQQSLDAYLQQLSGYATQIGDALARQTSLDARRLAVSMQGVVGRMQADIDSLSRGLGVSGPLDARQRVGDLQLRATQIAQLVDRIE